MKNCIVSYLSLEHILLGFICAPHQLWVWTGSTGWPNRSCSFVGSCQQSSFEPGSPSPSLHPRTSSPVYRVVITVVMESLLSVYECPVCLRIPDSAPIFMCENSHLVCGTCKPQLPVLSGCPVCRWLVRPCFGCSARASKDNRRYTIIGLRP